MGVKVLTLGLTLILTINSEKCTGCRTCEMACSFVHYKVFDPKRSAITIIKNEEKELCVPIICQHCADAPCVNACPVNALTRNAETGVVRYDENTCTLCRQCLDACPYGAIHFITDPSGNQKLIKCDLCNGDPECAKRCDPHAIIFSFDPNLTEKMKLVERRRKLVAR